MVIVFWGADQSSVFLSIFGSSDLTSLRSPPSISLCNLKVIGKWISTKYSAGTNFPHLPKPNKQRGEIIVINTSFIQLIQTNNNKKGRGRIVTVKTVTHVIPITMRYITNLTTLLLSRLRLEFTQRCQIV